GNVVGTTSSVLVLVDQGRIDLDAPVRSYLPGFSGGEKDLVSVRMLLNHTRGLPSYVPLYRRARARDEAIDELYAQPLARSPGTRMLYSDLNALFLGLIVEAVAQQPLDSFAADAVFRPLGMRETFYLPDLPAGAFMAQSRVERGRPLPRLVTDRNADN